MNLELELAVRFLRRRSGALLRGTSLAAFAGVALATAALVITLALMDGYSDAIAAALQRGNAHLVGFSPRPLTERDAAELASRLLSVDGVGRVTPVTYLSGLIEDRAHPTNPIPITLKAIAEPPAFTTLDGWPDGAGIPAIFGTRLAQNLGLVTGSTVTVHLPPEGRSWILPALQLRSAGTFRLEFAEFDESWIMVPLASIIDAVPGTGVAGVEIQVDNPLAVETIREDLEAVEPTILFTDWREMNRSLFGSLTWLTLSLFVVLSLVVAVASFQVSSALVVLALHKRKAAGMLHALGATPARVRRILVWSGSLLGGSGVVAGIAFGCVVSWVMTTFRILRFPRGLARVYMVDHIPLEPQGGHLLAVLGVCALLVFLASFWPAWKTSREDPIVALKAI